MGQKRADFRALGEKMRREKRLIALVSASRLRSRSREVEVEVKAEVERGPDPD
jgi:hypothetical protein